MVRSDIGYEPEQFAMARSQLTLLHLYPIGLAAVFTTSFFSFIHQDPSPTLKYMLPLHFGELIFLEATSVLRRMLPRQFLNSMELFYKIFVICFALPTPKTRIPQWLNQAYDYVVRLKRLLTFHHRFEKTRVRNSSTIKRTKERSASATGGRIFWSLPKPLPAFFKIPVLS